MSIENNLSSTAATDRTRYINARGETKLLYERNLIQPARIRLTDERSRVFIWNLSVAGANAVNPTCFHCTVGRNSFDQDYKNAGCISTTRVLKLLNNFDKDVS